MYTVKVKRERPDFRVFIELLYGFDRNVDTDGNAYPVNSRVWSSLYIRDRESDDPPVTINAHKEVADLYEVKSEKIELMEMAALYLYHYCGEIISFFDKPLDTETIQRASDKYAVELERAKSSIWHQSTEDFPYPNVEPRE